MGLLDLPTELRMQIFEYLPELSYGREETIGPNVRLTPPICRVCHLLKYETLPLYAKTTSFIIQTDTQTRLQVWLAVLGDTGLSNVENLQLSKNWKLKIPVAWSGQIGFYLRLRMINGIWNVTAGTYPRANDMSGMRLESVDLLRHVIMRRLRPPTAWTEKKLLTRGDLEFVVDAMKIVASHPIPTFETDQSEWAGKTRRQFWDRMEGKLLALQNLMDGELGPATEMKTFHTPY